MILLLIIADDFTGALDTGVQFAAHGIRTQVVVDPQVDFSDHDAKVLVVDTETRHLPPKEAYDVVSIPPCGAISEQSCPRCWKPEGTGRCRFSRHFLR